MRVESVSRILRYLAHIMALKNGSVLICSIEGCHLIKGKELILLAEELLVASLQMRLDKHVKSWLKILCSRMTWTHAKTKMLHAS